MHAIYEWLNQNELLIKKNESIVLLVLINSEPIKDCYLLVYSYK